MKGRIRTIKPELAKHWLLWRLGKVLEAPAAGWYSLLWCWCDRRGRFTWEPNRLKAEIAPYDDVDFEEFLSGLANAGFLYRYRVAGRIYGWLPTLLDHQNINGREEDSTLPPPPVVATRRFEVSRREADPAIRSRAEMVKPPPTWADVDDPSEVDVVEELSDVHDDELATRAARVDDASARRSSSSSSSSTRSRTKTKARKERGTSLVADAGGAKFPAKRDSSVVLARLASVFVEISQQEAAKVGVKDLRSLQAQMVFLYWTAKFGHENAILDPKRERRIVERLRENDGDVSEILYALDGGARDDYLMGRDPRSPRKYDGIETLLRDRAQVERLARSMKKFAAGVPHALLKKLEEAVAGGGSSEVVVPPAEQIEGPECGGQTQ